MAKFTIYYGAKEPIKSIGVNQCRLLEFAEKYRGWHSFKRDRATLRAVNGLLKKCYIEVSGSQFRFTYPEK